MRRLVLLLSLCAVVAIPCAGASAAPRPLYTGVSGVYDYTPTAYSQVRATGASFVRIGVPWEAIAPEKRPDHWNPDNPGDPNYRWGATDLGVEHATALGLEPLLMVSTAPDWAEGCHAPQFAEAVCEPNASDLEHFATALATRFGGHFEGRPRVTYFQGLNEPNLSLYFLPQYDSGKLVSPDLYRAQINAFYRGVKKVHRSDLVLAAGLGPIAVPRYTSGPLEFARKLLCMKGVRHPKPTGGDCKGGVHFDIFDIHPYTTGGPTHEGGPTDVQLGDLPKLVTLLKAADRAGHIKGHYKHTPLWATEFGWDSKPPDPHGLPMDIEARWADEALFRASRAGVEHFFWYGLRDEKLDPNRPSSATLQTGLYFRGATVAADRPKKVMFAFRFPFVAYPGQGGGLLVWGRTPSGKGGPVRIQLLKGGHWRTAVKLKADSHGMFETTLPTSYGKNHVGSARAVAGRTASVPFSMKPVPDFDHAPFG